MRGPSARAESMSGLYLHVPFCGKRCRYCAFASTVYDSGLVGRYLTCLGGEAAGRSAELSGLAPATLYVGGGTPTCLSPGELRRLGEIVSSTGAVGRVKEMTVEANPASADARRLAVLREFGFDRVSLGAQSFDDAELKLLGRAHRAGDVGEAVRACRRAGFGAVSLDLIFGLPGQSVAAFTGSLERALELEPEHVSLYGLTWEEGTPLADELNAGLTAPPPQELEREMYLGAVERTAAAGYRHYEIANFALPGSECLHNLNYWRGGEYLGLGAGAFSFLGGERFGNARPPREYCTQIEDYGEAVEERERLEPERAAREALMLGLRLTEGVELEEFRARTGFDAADLFGGSLEEHRGAGRLELSGGRLRLTLEGILVANSVMADFI
ncbi:MAG: radical SAM family heme chaperone HemW [Planctomycetota bacterium]|jgi:oxygen-independent coproporphyrinogen-3 oxidase